jgi:hypothetical protein
MKSYTTKRSYYVLLLFVWSMSSLHAQKGEPKSTTPFTLLKSVSEKEGREKRGEAAEERKLAEWLKAPYLTTSLDKATVGELTVAFQNWGQDHPEEMRPSSRHRDDEVVKFQRKLYRWQMENAMDEVPVDAHQRLDAFVSYQKQNPESVATNFTNPDGNWRLLGPTSHPIDIPFTEPALSENKSMANSGIGRINCLEFSNSDTMNIWAGTSGGGVWKTWNGGKTWINL